MTETGEEGATRMRVEGRRGEIVFYLAIALIAAALLVPALRLWRADMRVPFYDTGDSVFTATAIKGLAENGSWIVNPSVGAPDGMHLQDFPGSDALHLASLWLLGKVTGDWAIGLNLYFLLGFPLAALVAAYVFREMGISRASSLVAAELFAFLPFHFLRGEVHLFLASYWAIPLTLLLCWRMFSSSAAPLAAGDGGARATWTRRWTSIAMAVVVACSGVYFAYFSCFFVAIAGVAATLRRRSWRALWWPILLIATIMLTVVGNVIPTLLYRANNGVNAATADRYPAEAVIYGLKFDQMLVPTSQYFIGRMAKTKRELNDKLAGFGAIWAGTNDHAWLGIAGGVGFLLLLGRLLFGVFWAGDSRRTRAGPLELLALLAVSGVLFATVGGFGALVAEFLFSAIRAYERISVFIALFGLTALALVSDTLRNRVGHTRRWVPLVVLGVLLCFGLVDQVGSVKAPNHFAVQARFRARAVFVAGLESRLPRSAMVFQLPYVSFPEAAPVRDVGGYDHFRPYLHSRTLRWSFGAVRGRAGDEWYRRTAELSATAMVDRLRREGFAAVWIDRGGYADSGREIEAALRDSVAKPPIMSADGRIAVYMLAPR